MSVAGWIFAAMAVVVALTLVAAVVLSITMVGSMARAPRDEARRARRAAARRLSS